MKLCFFDCETTGLDADKHEMISYALIVHEDLEQIYSREQKITPLRINEADPEALKVNKYRAENWRNASHPQTEAYFLRDFFNNNENMIIVGHNPGFDRAFLKSLIRRYDHTAKIPHRMIDTRCLAMASLFPLGLKSSKLDDIRDFLGWSKEYAHTALGDVCDTRDLFYLCRRDLEKLEWQIPKDRIEYT